MSNYITDDISSYKKLLLIDIRVKLYVKRLAVEKGRFLKRVRQVRSYNFQRNWKLQAFTLRTHFQVTS